MRHTRRRTWSIKRGILSILIPIVSLFMIGTNGFFGMYFLKHTKNIVSSNVTNSVAMATELFAEDLFDVFSSFVSLERKVKAGNFSLSKKNGVSDALYVDLYKSIFGIHAEHGDKLNVVFVGYLLNDHTSGCVYYSDDRIDRISLSFNERIGDISLNDAKGEGYLWRLEGPNEVFHRNGMQDNSASLMKVWEDETTKAKYLIYFGFSDDFLLEYSDQISTEGTGVANCGLVGEDGVFFWEDKVDSLLDTELLDDQQGSYRIDDKGKTFLIIYNTIKVSNWKFCAIINENQLYAFQRYFFHIFLATLTLAVVCISVVITVFMRWVNKPIDTWIQKLESVQDDNYEVIIEEDNCLEVLRFNDGLQRLLSIVRKLMNDIEEKNNRQRTMELKLLQEQVNPHFLYNTLYSIQELYNIGEQEEGNEMMSRLAGFFRKSLGVGSEIITLREELQIVDDYLHIQKMRHENFVFERDVDESLFDISVIKFSLQPIVENAIVHGLYGKKDGRLLITAKPVDGSAHITIYDNGGGIPESQMDKVSAGLLDGEWSTLEGHFGIRNVHERLRLHYGVAYNMTISSQENCGTRVEIVFPIERMDD